MPRAPSPTSDHSPSLKKRATTPHSRGRRRHMGATPSVQKSSILPNTSKKRPQVRFPPPPLFVNKINCLPLSVAVTSDPASVFEKALPSRGVARRGVYWRPSGSPQSLRSAARPLEGCFSRHRHDASVIPKSGLECCVRARDVLRDSSSGSEKNHRGAVLEFSAFDRRSVFAKGRRFESLPACHICSGPFRGSCKRVKIAIFGRTGVRLL
jgi:hypothetical protein